jgi:hypothetical protein
MSIVARNAERAKLKRLLELSQQQIKTLESDDMLAFDEVLAEKRVLIESLPDGQAVLNADPSLGTVVARIQDADKAAQRLLYQKVGLIMREMNRANQQEKARSAYRRETPAGPPKPIGFLPNSSTFIDARS